MFEYMEKYKWSRQDSTLTTIDKPMQAFLGLTYGNLLTGLLVGFALLVSFNSLFSILIALVGGVAAAFIAKRLSTAFPRKIISHWLFSVGVGGVGKVKNFFGKRRFVVLSP